MDLIKVIVIGVIVSVLAIFLKQIKPEYSLICIIVGSIVLIFYILSAITPIFGYFNEIVTKTGIDNELFKVLIKIIGVGYLVEFSASICADSGNQSIADKIVLAGKLLIFLLSLPIITSLFDMIMELIK